MRRERKMEMDQYTLISIFDKLDASLLEDLHLERDLKRHQRFIRRIFANGHVKIASIAAGIGLAVTGMLILFVRIRRKNLFGRIV